MSETNNNPAEPTMALPDSQHDRWFKYGANVVLTTLVVIALAAAVTWAAQRKPKRLDTTSMGLYSLKPQTINLIKDNKEKIKIISLYTKSKPPQQPGAAAETTPEQTVADQAQIVSDLLDEYKNKGQNIDVEAIDPVTSPTKLDDLITEVTQKYGGQVDKYKAFIDSYPAKYKKIVDLGEAELAKVKPLAEIKGAADQERVAEFVGQLTGTLSDLPKQLQLSDSAVKKALREKPPNYKGVVDRVQASVTLLSEQFKQITDQFNEFKENKTVPETVRKYMVEALPRYEDLKKTADAISEEIKGLGELKLDTLRDALRQKNSILVRGENDWKLLPYNQVWKADNRDIRLQSREGKVRPRFGGEQLITTAIWSLEHPKKQKVAFVRSGGPPITEEGMPDIPGMMQGRDGGFLSSVAARLTMYNYEVLEKDLTGSYARTAQQQGQPVQEPSDEDIKDAVWVVLAVQNGANPMGGGPPPTIAPKIMEHLSRGGSALILGNPRGDDMSLPLKDWGIELKPNAMCVHELIDAKSVGAADMIEEAKKAPFIFEIRDWGQSAVTSPLRSLSGILVRAAPVLLTGKPGAGVQVTSILPIPTAPSFPAAWGETDLASADATPKYDKDADVGSPLYGGAIAEKDGGKGGRVVVVGTPALFVGVVNEPTKGIVDFPDPELAQRRIYAARFPGNGELFMNSIFWLSHQDPMIAISPAAMDIARIGDMSQSKQQWWRVGVLLIGLPGAVLLAGAMVWLSRRD